MESGGIRSLAYGSFLRNVFISAELDDDTRMFSRYDRAETPIPLWFQEKTQALIWRHYSGKNLAQNKFVRLMGAAAILSSELSIAA